MSRVANMKMASCEAPQNNPKKLEKPPLCSSGRTLSYETKKTHTGPFKNRSMLSVPDTNTNNHDQVLMSLINRNIPKNWSWRDKGGNMIEDGSRNQSSCGCCWAMGFVSALGDRYALKYKIAAPYPSVMSLISCGGPIIGSKVSCATGGSNASPCPVVASQQCDCGGNPYLASLLLEDGVSIQLEECWPFSTITNKPKGNNGLDLAPDCPNFGDDCCADCCGNPASKPKFTVQKGSTKYIVVHKNYIVNPVATIHAIKLEILDNGPVVATFWVPSDFESWWQKNAGTNKIYIPTVSSNPPTNGGQTVVLTGWGEENGVKFWEMRNTWGKPGYMRFAMSISTPKEFWTSIDIPEFKGGAWRGGVFAMTPGPLSEYNWKKGTDISYNTSSNWISKILLPIMMILLAIILIIVIINIIRKRNIISLNRRR